VIAALLLAASLSPALERQMLASIPQGARPQRLSLLLEVPDGNAKVLALCGFGGRPIPLLARVSASGELQGAPVQIPPKRSARSDCGTASASAPFTLRRKGEKPKRALVVAFDEGGKPFLSVAITLEPEVVAASDGALEPRQEQGETSFCERQSDGSRTRLAWDADLAEYSAAGSCRP
jgi:hypothetical protein